MKTIIAGSRTLSGFNLVEKAVKLSGFQVTEVVSGKEPKGIDNSGEQWARFYGIPVKPFRANWKDLSPPCRIKYNPRGQKYNALAGFKRNEKMAQYADCLIAIWDGKSPGTKDVIQRAIEHLGKENVYVYRTDRPPEKPVKEIRVIRAESKHSPV